MPFTHTLRWDGLRCAVSSTAALCVATRCFSVWSSLSDAAPRGEVCYLRLICLLFDCYAVTREQCPQRLWAQYVTATLPLISELSLEQQQTSLPLRLFVIVKQNLVGMDRCSIDRTFVLFSYYVMHMTRRKSPLCGNAISPTKPEVPNIAMSPEKDRAMAAVNIHRKFGEVRPCGF